MIDAKVKATNVVWHHAHVTKVQRESFLNQRGGTVWLTGFPSSGKSTTAYTLEHELFENGYLAYVLDGDNVRHGLNKDLGFSGEERAENIRRVAEVAKLFADAGILTITSFISPYRVERDFARQIHREAGYNFAEIFIDTPLDVCEARDPKGLFAKARRGGTQRIHRNRRPLRTAARPGAHMQDGGLLAAGARGPDHEIPCGSRFSAGRVQVLVR